MVNVFLLTAYYCCTYLPIYPSLYTEAYAGCVVLMCGVLYWINVVNVNDRPTLDFGCGDQAIRQSCSLFDVSMLWMPPGKQKAGLIVRRASYGKSKSTHRWLSSCRIPGPTSETTSDDSDWSGEWSVVCHNPKASELQWYNAFLTTTSFRQALSNIHLPVDCHLMHTPSSPVSWTLIIIPHTYCAI